MSELLTLVIDPMINNLNNLYDCDSTEDMLAAVHLANNNLKMKPPVDGDLSIFSMDAEALYPSLDIEDINDSVWQLVMKSNIDFQHIDIETITKFVAVMYSKDELRKHQVISIVPKRQLK